MFGQINLSRKLAIVGATLTAVPLILLSSPSWASQADDKVPNSNAPDDPVNEWAAQVGPTYLANESRLAQLKDWILQQDPQQTQGYIDQIDDPSTGSTKLLWSGSSALQAEALTQANDLGLTATVEQRPFDWPTIQATESVLFAATSELANAGFNLQMTKGIEPNTTKLEVDGYADDGADLSAITVLIQKLSPIPVIVNFNSGADLVSGTPTRQTDSSPFFAGDLMYTAGSDSEGHICSTGFAVTYTNGQTTYRQITTARHCDLGTEWYDDGDRSTPEGHVIASTSYAAVGIMTGDGDPDAYDGAWNNSAGYSKGVWGVETPGIGDKVCTGGGNSGEHCNVQITASGIELQDTSSTQVSTVEGTEETSGGIAEIQGDSGGPVIVPITSGSGNGDVWAVGMIQGGESPYRTNSSCGSIAEAGRASDPNKCSQKVLFSYMSTMQNHTDISVIGVG